MALIDRIKYDAPSDDAIVWKYPSDEIRLGAQLIVNQSQEAVFFKGGKALDTFGPGTHTLASDNLPLLGRLFSLPFGGKTPFAAEVWFVNQTAKRDLKWGTQGPVQVIDPVYNFPVSVRAFGTWGFRVSDARSFVVQIVGTQVSTSGGSYIGSDRVENYFSGEIIQRLSDALAKYFAIRGVSAFQVSAHINDLSSFVGNEISSEFERFGVQIVNFNVGRISIPEEEQKRFQDVLGKRMEIDQISQARVGQAYSTMRSFDTLEKAAANEGGSAGQMVGAGLGLGVGFGAAMPIGQQVGGAMSVQADHVDRRDDPMAKLREIKQMLESGLITQEDFDQKKRAILDAL
jgi:membrane protease subunit (stomatin/prohibitin family)